MITSKQRAYLRGLASKEDTILQIGKDGITENTVKSMSDALKARELAGTIAREVMGRLSDDDLNALIYDKIEPDLLWIRMNGSIVGAVIGFFMFILLEIIPGLLN